MRLVDLSVERPVRVWVVVLLAALFGTIAITTLPLQLAPTVDRPEITVETIFPGAAPLEVEQQLTDKIEEKVNSVEGVDEITSTSREGQSSIVLKFDWGVNKDVARLDVSEKLGLVKDLPEDAERSVIRAVNSDEEQPIAWIAVDTTLDPVELSDELEDVTKARFERLPGVGSVLYFGSREREVHVVLDLDALSARGLSVGDVRAALTGENRNERGGTIEAGKTRWVVRTVGQFTSIADVEDTVVATGAGGTPVRVRDVARVSFGREKRDAIVRQNGKPALVLGVLRRTGANVVEVMRGVREEVAYQNRVVFRGRPIRLVQVYDETEYIEDAKSLLVGNLVVGALLATAILLLFLKSMTSTIVIGLSIPISLLTTFVVLQMLGRSLNIISLAGLAFASGMVVDNAIVVLENVFRHRVELKKPLRQAARDGTVEVWGALVASTLTTLAVFIPIVFVKEEAGQLFRDIAIAISGAVGISLLVAITVVPMLSARVLRTPADGAPGPLSRLGARLLRPVDILGGWFVDATGAMVAWLERGLLRRIVYLGVVLGAAVWAFVALLPPRDYLPQGNRNLILAFAKVPAGYGLEEQDRIVTEFERRILSDPRVDRLFSVVSVQMTIVGTIVKREHATIGGMQSVLADVRAKSFGIPGAMFFVTQTPIFRRGGGFIGGTTAEVRLRGPDLEALSAAAARVERTSRGVPDVIFVRSSFEFGNPELQVRVDRAKAADLGLRVQDVGYAVATLIDGTKAGIFREEGKERDVRLLGPNAGLAAAGDLERLRLVVPRGGAVRLSDLAQVRSAEGPTKVEHEDLDRSVTLQIGFKEGVALDEAVARIERAVLEPLRPTLPVGFTADVGGQAKDLDKTWTSLSAAFLLGLLVIYLLMAMLFDSFLYPFVIMLTVPFAMTGGVLGAAIAHAFQPLVLMDVITMLGFVILAGTVVNNSILIVHQALNFQREEGHPLSEALVKSVRSRIRPIFMTVATTVLGMLPLVLTEGSGSELYRGLGAVVIGGLVVSTLFTLTVTPAFMSLAMDMKAGTG
ncbi:MAG TPA: efflux RND transporter permease subunit, partial [Planctomycetota bacterium]|nr:efflux RND transporter permease subunit [Planctomycetota bacterium]